MIFKHLLNMLLVAAMAVLVTPSAHADSDLNLNGAFMPGALIIGQIEPGETIAMNGKSVRVSSDGRFLLGLARNATGEVTLALTRRDGIVQEHRYAIAKRDYKIQRIDGLPKKQVTPDPVAQKRIQQDNALIKAARKHDGMQMDFANGFAWPVLGPISGVFGSQRILNGKPRSPHNGTDIAAPTGTVIGAMGDGTVVLVHDDMFYTGKTVMIDHGHGLTSVYAHMSELSVTEGQRVNKTTPIGKIGKTGRVTGPHLHWGVTLFSTHLDPALIVGPMPKGS